MAKTPKSPIEKLTQLVYLLNSKICSPPIQHRESTALSQNQIWDNSSKKLWGASLSGLGKPQNCSWLLPVMCCSQKLCRNPKLARGSNTQVPSFSAFSLPGFPQFPVSPAVWEKMLEGGKCSLPPLSPVKLGSCTSAPRSIGQGQVRRISGAFLCPDQLRTAVESVGRWGCK